MNQIETKQAEIAQIEQRIKTREDKIIQRDKLTAEIADGKEQDKTDRKILSLAKKQLELLTGSGHNEPFQGTLS